MKKTAILFDLDGTLLNSLPDIARCMNEVLKANSLPVYPQADYRYMTGNGALLLTQRAVGTRQDLFDKVLREYSANYAAHCYDTSYLYDGIPELIAALAQKGLRLVVLSNKDDGDVKNVIRHYFPDMPFEITRGRLPGVPLKPDPSAANNIAAEMGLTAADFWYMGDTPTDYACAKAAKMDFIALTWGFRSREELFEAGAERFADTPQEALNIMLTD